MSTRALVLLLAVLGCKNEQKPCPPPPEPPPSPSPSIDPLLVGALCALSLTPPGSGTAHSDAGVVTNGKQRASWISRDYDARFVSIEDLDKAFAVLAKPSAAIFEGLMPSSFCPPSAPIYVSIYVYNATHEGKTGAWIVAGELTNLTKKFLEVSGIPTKKLRQEAVAPVIALLGAGTKLERLRRDASTSLSGVSGAWEEAFAER